MKLLRVSLCAALALLAGAAPLPAEPAAALDQQFRSALAARMGELGPHSAAALMGLDHWLFLVSELRFLSCETFWGNAAAKVSRSPKAEAADPIPAIVDFQRQLKARGIDLLLVPVPPKAAIYPDKLLTNAPGGEGAAIAPLQRFYQELSAQGVEVLDLAPLFASQRTEPDSLYCKTDTHWSGAGCVLAAKAIAERVRPKIAPPEKADFAGEWRETEVDGDLIPLLPADAPKPSKEKLRLRHVSNKSTAAAVEPNAKSPLLVLGDSHTLIFHDFSGERSGLLDQLALELGAAPDLIGTRGSGSTAVRISLYRRTVKDPAYLPNKKVVVWCFTSREFTESDQGWSKVPISR